MGKNGFLQEFKTFAMKGNVVDMAVGIIIGAAFGKIVSSVVNDLIMPFVGLLVGGVNFADLKWVLKVAEYGADGKELSAPVVLNYGTFIQTTFDFLVIAFSIFLFIRLINRTLIKKEEPKPEEKKPQPPVPTKEESLLAEIRDLLKEKR